jgi:hypothetical protein
VFQKIVTEILECHERLRFQEDGRQDPSNKCINADEGVEEGQAADEGALSRWTA